MKNKSEHFKKILRTDPACVMVNKPLMNEIFREAA
tara:strand:+ start:19307 stop:19411 length:105 start_codon:yes stop_codon:yes gene_type:complete